jgi:hypothetical protein
LCVLSTGRHYSQVLARILILRAVVHSVEEHGSRFHHGGYLEASRSYLANLLLKAISVGLCALRVLLLTGPPQCLSALHLYAVDSPRRARTMAC